MIGSQNTEGTGAAYVFALTGSGWTEQEKIVPCDATTGDEVAGDGLDLDGTTLAVGSLAHPNRSIYGAVWMYDLPLVNLPPIALCQDVNTTADSSCRAAVAVDEVDQGSNDPDNDPITLGLDPVGPFDLGMTGVILTADDGQESDFCSAEVTVTDATSPIPDDLILPVLEEQCTVEVVAVPTATDNCAGDVLGTTSDPLLYAEQGNFAVQWTFEDNSGNSSQQAQAVLVQDTQPPSDVILPVVEGQCSAQIGAAPTAEDNCAGTVVGTTPDPLSYDQQGGFQVTWTFDDGNGNTAIQSQQVIVQDTLAPTVLTQPLSVELDASGSASITPAQVDAGSSDNCSGVALSVAPNGFDCSTVGANPVVLSATDAVGNLGSAPALVTVLDSVRPSVVCPGGVLLFADNSCQAVVPDFVSATQALDACGISAVLQTPLVGTSVGLGSTPVEVSALDVNGNVNSCFTSVTVADATPPVVVAVQANPNPVAVDEEVTITADIEDLCTNIVSAEYSLDGGVTFQSMDPIAVPSTQVTASVTLPGFTEANVLSVCTRGTDEYGNTSDAQCIFLPVYDPDGGFVTGGGWIWSPQGAYPSDLEAEGQANFGFVSKYKKGANQPIGQTQFHFQAGDLNFHSDSYDWLVIAGSKAMYKGVGSINGEGEFKFMLTAGDGDLKNTPVPDTFRIRIWEEVNGVEETVYDNQLGDELDADATTEVQGSIIIHKAKK